MILESLVIAWLTIVRVAVDKLKAWDVFRKLVEEGPRSVESPSAQFCEIPLAL